jgi:hypothetical protein
VDPLTSGNRALPAPGNEILDALLLALVAVAMGFVLARVDSDPDLWGRIEYARLALEQGRLFPVVDPYSYTAPGAPWQDHEYGFSWLAWGVHRVLGWPGLRLLRLELYFATLALCLAAVWRSVRGRGVMFLPLFSLCAFALGPGFMGPRAQSVSFLFFAWLLLCLRRAGERGPWWLVAGVLPMPIWLNVHGGFLAGCGIALVWGVVRGWEAARHGDSRTLRVLAVAAGWCLASLLLTPWGPGYPLFLLRAVTMPRPHVPEWAAPGLLSGNWWLVVALALATVPLFRARPRRWAELAAVAVTTLAALRYQRHIPFLAIAALAFAAPAALRSWSGWQLQNGPVFRRVTPPGKPVPRRAATVLASVLAAVLIAVFAATVPAVVRAPPAEPYFPASAVNEVERRALTGGLLVDFEWAQYVIFRRLPGVQVAFDGRYEAVYPEPVVNAFMAWNYGYPGWEELPNHPGTRMALVGTRTSRALRLLRSPNWELVYRDHVATLFVKKMGFGPTAG